MKAYEKETTVTLNDKMVIPTLLLNDVIIWYHENLQYPGVSRAYITINSYFYHLNLEKHIGICITKYYSCTKTKSLF